MPQLANRAAPFVEEVCTIPDLVDYQVLDGCQCDCVVAWGPLMADTPAPSPADAPVLPALPPMGPSKKAKFIQKLEVRS